MRFDGYYTGTFNDRYEGYLRFYPEGLYVSDELEPRHAQLAVGRLAFTHKSGQQGRGRWRLLEDGRLEGVERIAHTAFHPPPPGRRVVPRAGNVTLRGQVGDDRLELTALQDLHPEWTPIERQLRYTFVACEMTPETTADLRAAEDLYLGPPATRINPADGAELVEVDGLWLYRHPVTVRQFRQRLHLPDQPSFGWQNHHPMVRVTLAEASEYARLVGARLPTEAEWQRAAAGPDGRAFPWGNEPDPTRLTMAAKATTWTDRHPDGARFENALDLAGNAAEWCTDVVKGKRVVKGGSYRSKTLDECRCDARQLVAEDRCHPWLGFRCVLD